MTKARWLDHEEFRAWIGYRRLRLRLDAEVARDLMQASGLSMADYDVLSNLAGAPGKRARLTNLAARMLWSKSRLSRHLSRMESRGLVARDYTDRRQPDVVLTDDGQRMLRDAAPAHVDSVRAHFIDLLTREQLRTFAHIAETVLLRLPDPTGVTTGEETTAAPQ